MLNRRGFIGSVLGALAALPFIGKAKANHSYSWTHKVERAVMQLVVHPDGYIRVGRVETKITRVHAEVLPNKLIKYTFFGYGNPGLCSVYANGQGATVVDGDGWTVERLTFKGVPIAYVPRLDR